MKKLSKNKFAKLFATFLGASTILTPIATLVSCEQISKSPTIEQQNSNTNNNSNPETPNPNPDPNPNPNPNPDPDPNPNPDPKPTDPFKDSHGNTITITGSEATGYILTGSICINDINTDKFKTKLASFNNAELDTSTLNINCFTLKPERAKTQSVITTRDFSPVTPPPTYLSTEINPSVLKAVLDLKKSRNFSTLKLNNKTANGNTINIPFKSDATDYFDITDLAKFSFSDNFKITENSVIFLRAERDPDLHGTEDETKYAKTT